MLELELSHDLGADREDHNINLKKKKSYVTK